MAKKEKKSNGNNKNSQSPGDGNPNVLEGARAICSFINRSEPTLMKLIKQEGLEKQKVIYKRGGIWVANKERLKKWWVSYLENWDKV